MRERERERERENYGKRDKYGDKTKKKKWGIGRGLTLISIFLLSFFFWQPFFVSIFSWSVSTIKLFQLA